jgi:hypothetical protein
MNSIICNSLHKAVHHDSRLCRLESRLDPLIELVQWYSLAEK